jgi:iron complex outermembrane receptor protein
MNYHQRPLGRSHRHALLAASAFCAVMGVSAPALAQGQAASPSKADTTEVGEVIVTGFRNSLAKALNAKRESSVAVDTILAEDIGKFPDLNLSESIQRIPGVALARDGGEGRQIAVRGLGATFTRVRINGMEALASTGGADSSGGANRSRSFDFNVFASDLFSSIKVAKTAEAAQEEGSLGATVDLQAGRPFDTNSDFRFAASAQAGYNDLSKKTGPRLAALVSKTFADGKFGVLISGAYSKRDTIEEGSSTVRWGSNVGNFNPGFESAPAGGPTLAQLNSAFHPRFPRYDHFDNHNERIGLTGSLQWKPDDKTLVTFDALYADFKATRRELYLEAPSFSTGGACTAANKANSCGLADFNVVSATIDSNNVLTKGVFNDVDIRMENRFDRLDTKFKQFTLLVDHEFSDKLSAELHLGHSSSFHDNPFQSTLTFDKFNIQGYGYDYTDSRHPALTYGTLDLTDPSGWVMRELRARKLTAGNKYDSAKVSAKYAWSDGLKFSAGVDYKKYQFITTELRRVDAANSSANVEVFTAAQVAQLNAIAPLSQYSTIAQLNGKGLGIPAGTPTAWVVPDLMKAYGIFHMDDETAQGGLFKMGTAPALSNNKGVVEKDTGGFLQADFRTDSLGVPVRGNVGVRYTETDQESSGYTYVGGVVTPITAKRKYHDVLPSLNLVAEPREDLLIRFGASKVMARPELVNISPGATFNVAGATRSVTAGNPSLDPIRATNYDLAAEWYFQPGSLLSVALFKKKISSFVQVVTSNQSYQGNPFGLPDSAAIAACGNHDGLQRHHHDLGLLGADLHARRRSEGLRDQLPAGLQIPAGLAEPHRGAAELHQRHGQGELRGRSGEDDRAAEPDQPVAALLQRHALLRGQPDQHPGVGRLAQPLPDRRARHGQHRRHADPVPGDERDAERRRLAAVHDQPPSEVHGRRHQPDRRVPGPVHRPAGHGVRLPPHRPRVRDGRPVHLLGQQNPPMGVAAFPATPAFSNARKTPGWRIWVWAFLPKTAAQILS